MNGQAPSSQTPPDMRPTLIVGLGGTGQEVLVRLKARFLETFGPDIFSRNVVRLVALDTAAEAFQVPQANGEVVTLDKTDVIDIGNVPTVQVLRNLDFNYQEIKNWLPRDLPGQAITAGAKQIRPMGRLAFFYHFPTIARRLQAVINSLANINRRVVAGEVGTYIYVVSSLVGGTGSGIFLDTAYLLRYLCESLGAPNIHITGMLVLPQAFTQVASDQIKANAYAALTELDYFTSGSTSNPFNVEYTGGVRITNEIRPFTICYLVDGVNEEGFTLAGMPELAPLMSESIFLQISTRIGRQAASAFDNIRAIDGVFNDREGIMHPTAYSGFGMSSLVFPAQRILDVAGGRFAARLINQGLFAGTLSRNNDTAQSRFIEQNRGVVQSEVESLLERSQLRTDLILSAVSRDDQGRPLALRPEQSGLSAKALEAVSPQETPAQIAARARNFENNVLNTALRQQFEQNTTNLQASLSHQINEDVARILADLTRGLLLVDPFLAQLRETLSGIVTTLDKTRSERREIVERHIATVETSRQRLSQAIESWMDVGGRKRKQAAQTLINAHVATFSTLFEIMRLDTAIRLLSGLIGHIDVQRRELRVLTDQLESAWSTFEMADRQATENWGVRQSAREQWITSRADLEDLYNRYVSDIGQQVTRLTDPNQLGPIHTWRERYPSYEAISSRLLQFAQGVFHNVLNVQLEDEIMRKRDESTSAARLDLLRRSSVPFWSVQWPRVPDGGAGVESIQVIAVENKDTTIFRDDTLLAGTVTTTTLDPHRVTVLQTRHGIPIMALQQYDEYKRVYEQYRRRRGIPLHAFPIQDPRKAKQMFALGEAFGLISRDGAANYKLRHTDSLKEGADLGKGIEEALRGFSSNNDYITRVETMVEGIVRSKGEMESGKLVDSYVERAFSSSEHRQIIERELKMLAREYRLSYL